MSASSSWSHPPTLAKSQPPPPSLMHATPLPPRPRRFSGLPSTSSEASILRPIPRKPPNASEALIPVFSIRLRNLPVAPLPIDSPPIETAFPESHLTNVTSVRRVHGGAAIPSDYPALPTVCDRPVDHAHHQTSQRFKAFNSASTSNSRLVSHDSCSTSDGLCHPSSEPPPSRDQCSSQPPGSQNLHCEALAADTQIISHSFNALSLSLSDLSQTQNNDTLPLRNVSSSPALESTVEIDTFDASAQDSQPASQNCSSDLQTHDEHALFPINSISSPQPEEPHLTTPDAEALEFPPNAPMTMNIDLSSAAMGPAPRNGAFQLEPPPLVRLSSNEHNSCFEFESGLSQSTTDSVDREHQATPRHAISARERRFNPWNRASGSMEEDDESGEDSMGSDDNGSTPSSRDLLKRTSLNGIKRLSNFGRILRNPVVAAKDSERIFKRGSGSKGYRNEEVSNEDVNARLVTVVRAARNGRASISEVLEVLALFTQLPSRKARFAIYKWLRTTIAIDEAVSLLINDNTDGCDVPLIGGLDGGGHLMKHRNVLVRLYVTAHARLIRSFFGCARARHEVFLFFEGNVEPQGEEVSMWMWRASALGQLLNKALLETPSDTTELLIARRGLVKKLATTFSCVSEVCEVIARLCAAQALVNEGEVQSEWCTQYGGANAGGIFLLAQEGVVELLVDTFCGACDSFLSGMESSLWWLQVTNIVGCVGELWKRSVMVPKFNRTNCSFGTRHVAAMNGALASLSMFVSTERLGRMIDKGMEVCNSRGQPRFGDGIVTWDGGKFDSVRRDLPLVCVLDMVTEVLYGVRQGMDHASVGIRRISRCVHFGKIEEMLVNRGDRLLGIAEDDGVSVRARLSVIRLIAQLFASKGVETESWLVSREAAKRVMKVGQKLGKYVLVVRGVVECARAAMMGKLRRSVGSWGQAVLEDEEYRKLGKDGTTGVGDVVINGVLREFVRAGVEPHEVLEAEEAERLDRALMKMRVLQSQEVEAIGGFKPTEPRVRMLADARTLASLVNDLNAV